jgi:hypothetical protein
MIKPVGSMGLRVDQFAAEIDKRWPVIKTAGIKVE